MGIKVKGKTLGDFRAKYSKQEITQGRIRAALADLASDGPENWETEREFCRRAKVSPSTIGEYRGQFAAFIVHVSDSTRKANRLWFATEKAASAARKLIEDQECQAAI